jgi:hypothetical protein
MNNNVIVINQSDWISKRPSPRLPHFVTDRPTVRFRARSRRHEPSRPEARNVPFSDRTVCNYGLNGYDSMLHSPPSTYEDTRFFRLQALMGMVTTTEYGILSGIQVQSPLPQRAPRVHSSVDSSGMIPIRQSSKASKKSLQSRVVAIHRSLCRITFPTHALVSHVVNSYVSN